MNHTFHCNLRRSFHWYNSWHNHPRHKHAHWLVFVCAVLLIFTGLTAQILNFTLETAEAQTISLSNVTWGSDTNVSGWSQSLNLTSVTFQNNGDTICLNYDDSPLSTVQAPNGVDVVSNAWVFANIGGQWHASTWEYMRPGQTCKSVDNIIFSGALNNTNLSNWSPASGETVGFMISGIARAGASQTNEKIRSNIVTRAWAGTTSGGGGGGSSLIHKTDFLTIPDGSGGWYFTHLYAGRSSSTRSAIRSAITSRGYTHIYIYVMNENDYGGPSFNFYNNVSGFISRLQELNNAGIKPVVWLAPDDAPNFHSNSAQQLPGIWNTFIPQINSLVEHYVLGLEVNEYWTSSEVNSLGNTLNGLTNKPIYLHYGTTDSRSKASNLPSWADGQIFQYGFGLSTAQITSTTQQYASIVQNQGKVFIAGEYAYQVSESTARNLGDAAINAGAQGCGNGCTLNTSGGGPSPPPSGTPPPPHSPGTISGRVIDQNGAGVGGATIDTCAGNITTDSNGNFSKSGYSKYNGFCVRLPNSLLPSGYSTPKIASNVKSTCAAATPGGGTSYEHQIFNVTCPGDSVCQPVHDACDLSVDNAFNFSVTSTTTPPPPSGSCNSSGCASFVTQSVANCMQPGGSYPVSITMLNTGTTTWPFGTSYKIGSQNPRSNTTWGFRRIELPNTVSPGQQVIFNANVTAPTTPGTYNFQWRMLEDNVAWFGEFTQNIAVNVNNSCSPPGPGPVPTLPPPPVIPPTITSIWPSPIQQGQTLEVYGSNLTTNFQFTDVSGATINITGWVSQNYTNASVTIPDALLPGSYTVTIIGPAGSVTSPTTLTVQGGISSISPQSVFTLSLPSTDMSFEQWIKFIFDYSVYIVGIAVFIMIMWGGFLYMTSVANPGNIALAKSKIFNAILGAVLLISAYVILYTINPELVGGQFRLPGIQGQPIASQCPGSNTVEICNVNFINASDTSVTIIWNTNVDTFGAVNYWIGSLNVTTSKITPTGTTHAIFLTGLTPNTQYNFNVTATLATGGSTTMSPDMTFTTQPSSGGTACAISQQNANALLNGTGRINFNGIGLSSFSNDSSPSSGGCGGNFHAQQNIQDMAAGLCPAVCSATCLSSTPACIPGGSSGSITVNPIILLVLTNYADTKGEPFIVTSFTTGVHSVTSAHYAGNAVDIYIPNLSANTWRDARDSLQGAVQGSTAFCEIGGTVIPNCDNFSSGAHIHWEI